MMSLMDAIHTVELNFDIIFGSLKIKNFSA